MRPTVRLETRDKIKMDCRQVCTASRSVLRVRRVDIHSSESLIKQEKRSPYSEILLARSSNYSGQECGKFGDHKVSATKVAITTAQTLATSVTMAFVVNVNEVGACYILSDSSKT